MSQMLQHSAICSAVILSLSVARPANSSANTLYDPALTTAPGNQGWFTFLDGATVEMHTGSLLSLDTTANRGDRSGYFTEDPFLGLARHPELPVLDRSEGFHVRFELQVVSEGHNTRDDNGDGLDDRAGFSVIAISEDLAGLELAFFDNRIWTYAAAGERANSLFTQAEGAEFATTNALVEYDLRLFGESYILYADSEAILTGPLRNYNPSGLAALLDPYDNSSFIFVGDDTTSADSHVRLGNVSVPANVVPNPSLCDFNASPTCDVSDINSMMAQGDLSSGVSLSAADEHDLDGNARIDSADIDLWLERAAAFSGYGSAFLRGDTDGVSSIWPTVRDVDENDFNLLVAHFEPIGDGDPTNGPAWDQGNFNGDNQVDVTDFNSLAVNFAPGGYDGVAGTIVPEPAAILLTLPGLICLLACARWSSTCVRKSHA